MDTSHDLSTVTESGVQHEVIGAVDINTVANEIYKHNFPRVPLMNRCIESLQLKEFETLQPDLITMSPPCQPFARVGKQLDVEDPRTKSFLHLLNIISKLQSSAKYIFIENVKGFDGSEAHNLLLQTLKAANYEYQEFLISPLQCGIPNSRLRYYLLAKKKSLPFIFHTSSEIHEEFPECAEPHLIHKLPGATIDASTGPLYERCASICHKVEEYLENGEHEMLPEKFIKRFWVMDIAQPNSRNSCTFTKRYGHHLEGAGSVLQTDTDCLVDLDEYKRTRVYTDETDKAVRSMKLRFFSPREIANLMHFPPHFSFPSHLSTIQAYRVLGNSLNVHVVAVLMKLLLTDK